MKRKRNARSTAATVKRAEAAAFSGAAASFSGESNTLSGTRQVVRAADVLPVGGENAISAKTLAAVLGLKDIRSVSRLVELERRAGVPICAATGGEGRGYFLAASPGELKRYLDSLNRRICEVCRTRNACEETLRRMTGQISIVGW